jgi:TIR domain
MLNSSPIKKSVFISHASKNFAIADEIRSLLENLGVSCWIAPRDIPPSSSYGEEIVRAIELCSVTVFLLTEEANISRAVANELELSFNKQKVIIPLRLKNLKPSSQIEFYVSNAQWVDAFYTPLKQRINDIVAVVLAVEKNTKIPTPPPEKKTFLGQLEKKIEQLFRYKLLSLLGIAFLLSSIALTSLFLSYRADNALIKEKILINQDPGVLGLISAKIVDQSNSTTSKFLNIGLVIYKNLKTTPNSEINALATLIDLNGNKTNLNLKKMLPNEFLQDGQTLELHVPIDTKRISLCLTAPHPEFKRSVTAIWSYGISLQGNQAVLLKDKEPILRDTLSSQGEKCE